MVTVNGRQINFEQDMTVADALQAAGEPVDNATLVTVNGKHVSIFQLDTEPVDDGAEIKLLRLVSGG